MDEKPKKVSLRGLGRQIMRGLSSKPEEEKPARQEDSAYFQDDEAVLNWMQPADVAQPSDEHFSEPDFDAIFGEDTVILPEEKPARSLDDIFTEPVPAFQDIFGDVIYVEDAARKVAVADPSTTSETHHVPQQQIDALPDEAEDEPLPAWADDSMPEFPDEMGWEEEPSFIQAEIPEESLDEITEESRASSLPEVMPDKTGGIPDWAKSDLEVPEMVVTPPVIEPLEAPPVEEALPAPLPNSSRESAFGMGSPDEVHRGFIQPMEMESEETALPEEEKPVTRSAEFRFDYETQDEVPTVSPVSGEEAIPLAEATATPVNLSGMKVNRPAVAEITPTYPEVLPESERLSTEWEETMTDDEALPMPEQEFVGDLLDDTPYREETSTTELSEEEIVPGGEEMALPAPQEDDEYGGSEALDEAIPPFEETPAELEEEPTVRRTTGILLTEDLAQPLTDPFAREGTDRKPAREIFAPSPQVSDADLLRLFIDDARMRELYGQVEALQEQIVTSVRGDRGNTDTYQEELLQASNLLLQSRENYDEARAILYRVRADLARERRVAEDISRYRPLITGVYVGMAIFFFILMLLGPLVTDITDDNGIGWLGQSYYAMVAGYLGGLLFGARTLYKHSVTDRDFDAIHLYWYLTNPLLGFLTGFLAYLFIWLTVETSFNGNIEEVSGRTPPAMLLGAAVGYNQNIVTGILGAAQNRFSGGSSSQRQQ